jgi:hypothetical protein
MRACVYRKDRGDAPVSTCSSAFPPPRGVLAGSSRSIFGNNKQLAAQERLRTSIVRALRDRHEAFSY